MTRLAWHLFKRLMRIDVPLSLLAASLASVPQRSAGTSSVITIVTQIILTFTLVASTAGFVFGVWGYLRLYRGELAVYIVAGHRLRYVALVSYIYLIAGLAILLTLALTAKNWVRS